MTKRNLVPLLLLLVFAFTTGCGPWEPVQTPAPSLAAEAVPSPAPAETPVPEPTPAPDPIAQRVAVLSTEEKVGQLLVAGIEGTSPGDDARWAIREAKVGGIILFGRNVASAGQLAQLNNDLKSLNSAAGNAPLFLCVDEEGGMVSRMPPEVTDLPSAYDYIQAGGDPAARGSVLAAECAAFGFNVDFAPSLDIWSNPQNTVIGKRAFGTDAQTVTEAGTGCTYAMMDAGVIPVVKHFPGHGDTLTDSHVGLPVVEKSREALLENELLPFRAAIDGGAPAVMVAHILMTQLDPQRPASLSPAVVTGLLREELGFDGVVFTDDLTMGAVSQTYGMGEAAVLAVEAGCDMALVCHRWDNLKAARSALLEAVDSGRISMERLDESVYRVLALKAAYGLSDAPVAVPDVAALNREIEAVLP